MTNIYEKLLTIQGKLNAPKGQYNKFGGFSYRSCEDILTAVKPLLQENGCVLTITDEVVLIGERYYIEATAILTHEEARPKNVIEGVFGEKHYSGGDNDYIFVKAFAREADSKKGMDEAQITGAASSYARKYALSGLFAIDDNKDPDTMDNRTQTKKKPSAKKQAADSEYKCDDCGKVFEPQWSEAKQREYSAEEIYNGWKKQSLDGKVRCKDCLNKFLDASTENS